MNEIVLTERLKADYKALPMDIQKKLRKQIKFLAENPRHRSLQIHRIEGRDIGNFMLTLPTVVFFARREIHITCWPLALTN